MSFLPGKDNPHMKLKNEGLQIRTSFRPACCIIPSMVTLQLPYSYDQTECFPSSGDTSTQTNSWPQFSHINLPI